MEEIINSFENGQNRFLECNYFRTIVYSLLEGATERQIIEGLIKIIKEQDSKWHKP